MIITAQRAFVDPAAILVRPNYIPSSISEAVDAAVASSTVEDNVHVATDTANAAASSTDAAIDDDFAIPAANSATDAARAATDAEAFIWASIRNDLYFFQANAEQVENVFLQTLWPDWLLGPFTKDWDHLKKSLTPRSEGFVPDL